MHRRTLILIHGYIAVFFLPLAVLYAATGVLYIVGAKGTLAETAVTVALPQGWPQTLDDARAIATARLQQHGLPEPNAIAGEFELGDDGYYWRALTHGVRLEQTGANAAELRVEESDLLRQFVEIHKNHAGPLFRFLGIAFGLGMLLLIVSGAWMMFQSRTYRRAATNLLAGGVVTSIAAYTATVLLSA